MKTKVEYKDDVERESVITSNPDKRLIEEQNITEGNFLIFTDEPIYISVPEQELTEIKTKLESTQEAVDFLLMGGM